jgi:hypothetical protein
LKGSLSAQSWVVFDVGGSHFNYPHISVSGRIIRKHSIKVIDVLVEVCPKFKEK